MVILVAVDKFRGTLPAAAVADAIARAALARWPGAELVLQPLADGGEGTVEALRAGAGGILVPVAVTGPLGVRVDAGYGRLDDGTVAIEVASAIGFAHITPGGYRPLDATSRGVGELVTTVMEREGAVRMLVGIGGTTSTDGGTGAAAALGYRFLDAHGRALPDGGGALTRLARIDAEGARRPSEVVALADVMNPLLGERGCARVYGPTKGAGAEEVEVLEAAMGILAARIRSDLGVDVADLAGGGAGGGLGAGLVAFMGAELTSGMDAVIAAVDLRDRVADADLVVTGEGSLDRQTLEGKVAAGVASTAREFGKPCLVVAGRIDLPEAELRSAGFSAWTSLTEVVGPERALRDASSALTEAALTAFQNFG